MVKVESKIPELRFPEFEGEWEKKRYGDIYKFYSTNSFSRESLNYETGFVKNIHYGDIHTKFSTIFQLEEEDVPYINKDISLAKIKTENYCREGDLVIADASEDYADIGKTIEIKSLGKEKVLAGLHTFLARPYHDIMANGFAGYLSQTWFIRKQVMTIAQGTKVLGISTTRLGGVALLIPSLPEQQKIATFLTAVDDKIQQLAKKKDLLEQYKKGVMQKIFKQEIRFKDEDGKEFPDWKIIRGKKLFDSISNKKHNGELPILAASQERGMVLRDSNGINIQSSEASVKSYKIVEKGDFVISLRSFQGGIEYSYIKGICSPAYIILKPKVVINEHFFRYYFKKEDFITRLSKTVVGIRDGKQISYDAFSGLKLPYPCIKEQKEIAKFLGAIDTKIKRIDTQLESTKAFKKGLLQKMFV